MKLFIGNKYNLKLYMIPEEIEDSYLIKYHSSIDNEEKNINIINKNNKLIINNNLNMNIYEDNKSKESIELVNYINFKIFINDTEEELLVYCLPNELEYKDYAVKGGRLRIGQSPSNEISIKDNLLKTYIIDILKIENEWYVKCDKIPFYINKSTTTYSKLNYGDELFIAGLKVIWLKGFVRVSYLPNSTIYIPEYDIREFYDVYKTPVKLQELEQKKPVEEIEKEDELETIILENPPLKEKNNDLYYFIALGSSFTLAITSVATLLTIFLAIASGSSSIKEEKNLLIISICLIFCAILFPFIIKYFQKNSNDKKEGKRILQYSEYLKNQKNIIADAINKRANKLKRSYPNSEEWQKRILDGAIWSRNITSKDFLKIRFGTGDISADISIDSHKLSFTYENPILKDQLTEIQNSSLVMKKVPIPISLIENKYLPIIINEKYYKDYIDMLLLQLISFHSNNNLKIVFLVSEENHNVWNNYKYIPHVYDNLNEIRFFAYNKNDNSNVINYLEETYQNRIRKLKNSSISNNNDYYSSFNDYYLIITDKIQEINNYDIINRIIKDNNYGFSIVSFEKNTQKKYIDYESYLEVREDVIISNKIKSNLVIPKSFNPEYPKKINIYNSVKTIANQPIISYNNKVALPKELSLLDMYKVGTVEQLNILDRWKNNNSVISLGAPIGVTTNNEVVELNLHENQQGPHALIAGMVSSGKLELLKTYITSMCINYSPEEVQFVIIDYKNGNLVKSFKNCTNEMPHIVGTLTELNPSEIFRFYTSLKNEIDRRKEIFTNVQNRLAESSMNIYKYKKLYNEGVVKEAISHLFIVCYEYSELYNQYEEYFTELLNLIYSSNSVGLHLILSTQKPGEVLNNQILTNSRLKICLKVQSLNDSEEVLNRREAASINNPGRFYYEVGYNESFKQAQCAYSNSLYDPREVYKEKIDDTLNFITDSGIIYKEINEEKVVINNRYGIELDNIRDYINNLTNDKITIIEDLFLPSLSEDLSLSKLIRKYKYKTKNYQYNAIIGEYDNPSHKEQNLFTIDLDKSNNIIVYGLPGTGKSSLISTILFSICLFHSPKEVNMYILDNSDEKLKSFAKMPQVGEYTSNYEKDKLKNLLDMLNKEIKKRKTSLKEYGSFVEYNANSPYKLPIILIAIRDYKNFLENNKDLEEKYNELLQEGPNSGIIFITSVVEPRLLDKDTASNFKTILGTQFADPFDYRYVLDAPKGLVPKNCFGRGLTKISGEVIEYQTAFIASKEEVEKVILENAVELKNNYKTKVKPILVKLMAGDKKNEK